MGPGWEKPPGLSLPTSSLGYQEGEIPRVLKICRIWLLLHRQTLPSPAPSIAMKGGCGGTRRKNPGASGWQNGLLRYPEIMCLGAYPIKCIASGCIQQMHRKQTPRALFRGGPQTRLKHHHITSTLLLPRQELIWIQDVRAHWRLNSWALLKNRIAPNSSFGMDFNRNNRKATLGDGGTGGELQLSSSWHCRGRHGAT